MVFPDFEKLKDLASLVTVRNHLGILISQRSLTSSDTYKILNSIQTKLDKEFIMACLRLEESESEPEPEPEPPKVVVAKVVAPSSPTVAKKGSKKTSKRRQANRARR